MQHPSTSPSPPTLSPIKREVPSIPPKLPSIVSHAAPAARLHPHPHPRPPPAKAFPAQYEVVDLVDDDDEDEDDDEDGNEGEDEDGKDGKDGEDEEDEDGHAGSSPVTPSSTDDASRKQAASPAPATPPLHYPAVEHFDIDLRQTGPAISVLALRRQCYPQFYPSPPPRRIDHEEEKRKPREQEEESTKTKEKEAAAVTNGESTSGNKAKKPRKKRRRALDYYDVTDDFIDDSDLWLAEESHADSLDSGFDFPSKSDSQTSTHHHQHQHALTPQQLQDLLSRFTVSAPFPDDDNELSSEDESTIMGEKKKRKKKKGNASTTDKTGDETAKKVKEGAEKAGRKGKKDKSKSRRKKPDEDKSKPLSMSPEQTAGGTASQPIELDGSPTPTATSELMASDAAAALPPSPSAVPPASPPQSDSRPSTPEPPPPPPDIGSLHSDWLVCFESFPALPAIISLLEEILAERHAVQTAALIPPHLQPAAAATSPTQSSPPLQQQSSTESPVVSADSPKGDNELKSSQDSVPSASQTSASDSATAAAPRTRPGLRAKPSASLAFASSMPRKLPESLSKQLQRLGALLETHDADESTVNKFLSQLSRSIIWSKPTIKTRLILGRLEGQQCKYLKERFEVYKKLRTQIEAEIAQQWDDMKSSMEMDDSEDTVASARFLSIYKPSWSYMRLLLDFTDWTDDIEDAMDEHDLNQPKGSGGTPAHKSSSQAPQTNKEQEDAARAAQRKEQLYALWTTLDIPPDSYHPAHLPLLLCTTPTVYAQLPMLWMHPHPPQRPPSDSMDEAEGKGEGNDAGDNVEHVPMAVTLVKESDVELAIESAEKEALERAEEEERRREEAEEVERQRKLEEQKLEEERAAAAAKEEEERKQREAEEREAQRKKAAEQKAASVAAKKKAQQQQQEGGAAGDPSSVITAPAKKRRKKSSTSTEDAATTEADHTDAQSTKKKRKSGKSSLPPRSSHYAPLPKTLWVEKQSTNGSATPITTPTATPRKLPQTDSSVRMEEVPAAASHA